MKSVSANNMSADHRLLKVIEKDLGHAEKSEMILKHKVELLSHKSWVEEIISWFQKLLTSLIVILSMLLASVCVCKLSCVIIDKVKGRKIQVGQTMELCDYRILEKLEARITCIENNDILKGSSSINLNENCSECNILSGIVAGIVERSGIDVSKLNPSEKDFIENSALNWRQRI